jgi:hypothetical protein
VGSLLDKLVLDTNIHFSGYDIPVQKDRNSDGDGIIMYYKTHVNIKRRVDLKNPLVECTWFELKTKLQNILINLIYRSERQSHHRFWDFFDAMLKNAMEDNTLLCHLHRSFYLFALEYRNRKNVYFYLIPIYQDVSL